VVAGALRRLLGRGRSTVLVGLVVSALALPVSGAPEATAQTPSPPAPSPARESLAAAIPVAEVATRAAEATNLLRELTTQLALSPASEAIRKEIPRLRELIDQDLAATAGILQGQPSLDVLQAHQQLWQRRQLQATEWLNRLTHRATLLQGALNHLADLRKTWSLTAEAAKASKAPAPILIQIEAVLADIEATEKPLSAQRTAVLDLQSVVAQEVARSGAALAQFTEAQQRAMGGILARDSPPIWSTAAWEEVRTALRARASESLRAGRVNIDGYVRDPAGMPLHVGIVALLALVLSLARRRLRQWTTGAEGPSPATVVFDRPYAATVVVALLAVAAPNSPVPLTVRNLFAVVGLAAAIRLTRLGVDRRLAPELYMLWILFAVDSFRGTLGGVPVVEQALLALEMLAGLAVLRYSLTRGRLQPPAGPRAETGKLPAWRLGIGLVMLSFAVALIAGAVGYMRLARLLASGILGSGALALTLYAGTRVVLGMVAFMFRVWPLRLLHLVQEHRALLERRVALVLTWLASIGWVTRTLDYVGLLQPALSFVGTVLVTELGRGSIRISVGNLLEFIATVWVAYLFSAFVRFVLREDVYPRTRLTRGLSYAISSLLNYVIIALGFLLALGVLGLDLTKMTILVSAFGVGIGFGLQSVVNNFVSGLILLFERPIHVGDIVELGNLSGEVSRIGIRASTVRTWQGAEIIVPNAQLVTERVTNWTLSDRTRRIDLHVGVDYGSAPEKVVEVLEAVARAHPEIMQTPPPQAVFSGFGDSSINYQLRAWTNRFERWPKIQTELVVAAYAALHAAGMSFPFPQREVRLLHDAQADSATPSAAPADRPTHTG
jgi:small-conductance mechanosensitive channel